MDTKTRECFMGQCVTVKSHKTSFLNSTGLVENAPVLFKYIQIHSRIKVYKVEW